MRGHLTKQLRLVAENRQVGQAIATVDERHRQLSESDTGIVATRPLRPTLHRDRCGPREAQSIGQLGDEERARMAHYAVTVGGYRDTLRARIAFILEVPSWVGMLMLRQHQFPLPGGRFCGSAPMIFR